MIEDHSADQRDTEQDQHVALVEPTLQTTALLSKPNWLLLEAVNLYFIKHKLFYSIFLSNIK